MKRIIPMILACLVLTACAGTPDNVKNSQSSQTDSREYLYTDGTVTYADDLLIKEPKDCELYTFTLTQPDVSQEKALQKFEMYYDKYFAQRMQNKNKQEEQRFVCHELRDDSKSYPNNFPKISEHRNDIISEKIKTDELFIENDMAYLDVLCGRLHFFNTGQAFEYLKQKGMIERTDIISPVLPATKCSVKANYFTQSDDKVRLSDGEFTVTEVQNKALGHIKEVYGDTQIKPAVSQTRIVDMQGQDGVILFITGEYNGVPLDAHEMKGTCAMQYTEYSNGCDYSNLPANAFMMSQSSLDSIYAADELTCEVSNVQNVNQTLTLKDALAAAEQKFSQHVRLNVRRAELVYTKQVIGPNEYSCRPAWKLSATADSGTKLFVYVDVQNSDCYYYESRQ